MNLISLWIYQIVSCSWNKSHVLGHLCCFHILTIKNRAVNGHWSADRFSDRTSGIIEKSQYLENFMFHIIICILLYLFLELYLNSMAYKVVHNAIIGSHCSNIKLHQ